jgi:hypothetical protein
MIQPATYPIVCPAGATFDLQLLWEINATPVDLTGYEAKLEVKTTYSAAAALITAETSTGEIVLDDTTNIQITIDADVTAAVPAGNYVYDLKVWTGAAPTVTRLIQGKWQHTGEVSDGY